jgi:hypothetical protein
MLSMLVIGAVATLMASGSTLAAEFKARGVAQISTAGKKDPRMIRAQAMAAAKREAVIYAINKVLGPGSTNRPEVAAQIDGIIAQIGDDAIVDSSNQSFKGVYEQGLTLSLDEASFRRLLVDTGVGNYASFRASSILVVMDEYVTTPRDLQAPLSDLTIYRQREGESGSLRARSSEAAQSSSGYKASAASSSNGAVSNVNHASGAAQDGYGGAGAYNQGSATRAAYGERSAGSVSAVTSDRYAQSDSLDIKAERHDNVDYVHLVKYQPRSKAPSQVSLTYNAMKGSLQNYNLRVLDNDVFRSRYFGRKAITLDDMTKSAELAKYVTFARNDAKADYFMAGAVVLVDAGRNPNTGEMSCSGVFSFKTYSTSTSEDIAADTVSETASGMNADACSANLAQKLAVVAGEVAGPRIQTYFKNNATYGGQTIVTLTGGTLSTTARAAFLRGVKATPGVQRVDARVSSDSQLELVVAYNGEDPLDLALAGSLSSDSQFSRLGSRTSPGTVLMCLNGPCPSR